jgi:hypothetical protein
MAATASRIAAAIAFALGVAPCGEAAPALEYAPDAEQRFVAGCVDAAAMTPAACRTLMEALRRRLGHAGFLEFVASEAEAAPITIPRYGTALEGGTASLRRGQR